MAEKYEVERTSKHSVDVSDKTIYETSTTRLLLRPEIVENPKDRAAVVKVSFIHQRKARGGAWENSPTEPLSKLKAGEEANLHLHSISTLELFRQLDNLYTIATKGKIGRGKTSLVVGREEEVIQVDSSRKISLNKISGFSVTA